MKLDNSSNVGHVPDPFARILAPMLDGGIITCMEGTVGDWSGVARLYVKTSGFLVKG